MTKFVFTSLDGGPKDYPTLGFSAVTGAILDGSLSTPAITLPPTAEWAVYGGASVETGINRYAAPAVAPTYTEPTDGDFLRYSDTDNSGTWQSASDLAETILADPLLADAFVAKGNGDPSSSLTPLYASTVMTGLNTDSPDNLRTGLSAGTYADGGYSVELAVAVTGTKGSKVLTSAETTKVTGLGNHVFEAVLNSADGLNDFFVTVVSTTGSTQINLRAPLAANFTGTLSAKYDAALGQHLTRAATKAYAQWLAQATGLTSSRGAMMAGTWDARPVTYDNLWTANAALTAFGVSNSADPIVRSICEVASGVNILSAVGRMPLVPVSTASGIRVGTRAAGHGATATLYPSRKDAVVEFYTGTYRSTVDTPNAQVLVTVKADGITLYSATHDPYLTKVTVPVHGADKVTVDVSNTDGGIYYIYVTQLTMREAGFAAKVSPLRKIVTMGDSWFERYAGQFATSLAAKTGATVINHSLGGQTTEWALSWFDTYVLAEKPDEVWFHFFTNDSNDLSASTFVAPDGSSKAKWPAGLTTTQALAWWRQNLLMLIQRCQAAGIKPVIVKPGGTAAESQTDRHMKWNAYLEQPAVLPTFPVTAAELLDVASYVNTVGKAAGTQVRLGTSRKTASGPLPADTWANLAEDSLIPLQKATLSRATYSVSTGVAINTDTDANGLSDGLVEKTFGTRTGDVITYSLVGGNQRISTAYGTGTGNARLGANFTAVSGKSYLFVAKVLNGPASDVFDAVSDITGSALGFATAAKTLSAGGAGTLYYRATANASATKYAAATTARVNSTTKAWDLSGLWVIDVAALLADAPNLANLTDAELAAFVVAMKP